MRLLKFRIKHYKSIIDSGYCTLAEDLTVLIGKNESGKTAVLEALRDFDQDALEVPPDAFPIDEYDATPLLEMCFQVERPDMEAIQSDCGITLPENILRSFLENGLTVTKDAQGQYAVQDETLERLLEANSSDRSHDQINAIRAAKEKLAGMLAGRPIPELNLDGSIGEISDAVKKTIAAVKSILPSLPDKNVQEEVVETMRSIIEKSNELQDESRDSKVIFTSSVVKKLPRIVFLTEFEGSLPFEIPLSALKDNPSVVDFAKIANLDLDKVIHTEDVQKRINLLNKHSAIVSGEFLNHWQQNKVELVIKPEGEKILFGVKEKDKTDFFKIQQRSKGFQWFLSFYLRLNTIKSRDTIILIDEPGVHLHARAQKEVLNVLEAKIAPESQVIFSTHSSYLIDALRLDRIRVLTKDLLAGSVISNHVSPDFDEDTLTPVSTALGIDLSHHMPEIGERNIVTSSMADFYYLKAWKEKAKNARWDGVHLLPSVDTQQLFFLVSMMLGQDRKFQVLLTPDSSSQGLAGKLKDQFGLGDGRLTFVHGTPDFAIEDLFTHDDFNNAVLGREKNNDVSIPNSRFLRERQIDRSALAQGFFRRAADAENPIKLSEETLVAFDRLFDKILHGFSGKTSSEPESESGRVAPETISELREEVAVPAPEITRRSSFFSHFKKK